MARKPDEIPARYRKGGFVASDPKAFDVEPPAFLRARKPQPPLSPSDAHKARVSALWLGVALVLIVSAVLIWVYA